MTILLSFRLKKRTFQPCHLSNYKAGIFQRVLACLSRTARDQSRKLDPVYTSLGRVPDTRLSTCSPPLCEIKMKEQIVYGSMQTASANGVNHIRGICTKQTARVKEQITYSTLQKNCVCKMYVNHWWCLFHCRFRQYLYGC